MKILCRLGIHSWGAFGLPKVKGSFSASVYQYRRCEKCGVIGVHDQIRNRRYCPLCDSSRVYPVEMSYGFKLMLDELKALGIFPKIVIGDKA